MAASLNKALLIGNLTRDPDLKYTTSGTAVANFGLAINRTYTDTNGEKAEDVYFVDVVTWNRLAEVCAEAGDPAQYFQRALAAAQEVENTALIERIAEHLLSIGESTKGT